jgi:hypothetical protein
MLSSIARFAFVRRSALAIALVALLAVALLPRPASAAPPYAFDDPAHPSAVTVTGGLPFLATIYGVRAEVMCVTIVNKGPRTATRISLNLAAVDAAGTIAGVDVMSAGGTFPVGVPVASTPSRGDVPNGNCHTIWAAGGFSGARWSYPKFHGPFVPIVAFAVSAREIQYDDGAVWKAESLPQTDDHVALPASAPQTGLVSIAAMAAPGSPADLTDAYLKAQANRQDQIPRALEKQVCIAFVNHDARIAKLVRAAFAFVNADGKVLGVQAYDIRGRFASGLPFDEVPTNCATMNGTWQLDGTFQYTDPQTGVSGRVARIVTSPLEVDFVDGTSWQSANPPKAGDVLGSH